MRRFVSAIVLVGIISPASALGAAPATLSGVSRIDLQTAYQNAIQQAITLLMQEVSQLEAQLAALTANQTTGYGVSAIACTQEAMRCPDGSYVGRTGPACAFATCPAVSSSSIATSTPSSTYTVSSLGRRYIIRFIQHRDSDDESEQHWLRNGLWNIREFRFPERKNAVRKNWNHHDRREQLRSDRACVAQTDLQRQRLHCGKFELFEYSFSSRSETQLMSQRPSALRR